jgi:hypothetical protein
MRIALCIHKIQDPRLQRYLSRTLDAEDAERVKALITDPTQIRRMNDLGKPAMGLALYPAPAYLRAMAETGRAGSALLTNAQLYETLRLRLGLTLLSNSQGKCTICGKEVANADQHLLACMAGGIRTKCHDSVVDSISQLLVDLGFMVRTEVLLFADQKRMDIVVNVGGINYALDTTVVSPLTTTTAKPAVSTAATAKIKKYGKLCEEIRMKFVPAAFDMWGNRCDEFQGWLAHATRTASLLHPHVTHSDVAIHSRITVAVAKTVGTLLATQLAWAPAPIGR